MALESAVKIKVLDEYIETLKQDLLFSMVERKLKSENTNSHTITRIKRELDKAAQERMRLSQIHHSNINNTIALTAATA
jgi:D-hexose-6-phosphate mutarotase